MVLCKIDPLEPWIKKKAVDLSSWPLWIVSDFTWSSSGSYQLKVTAQKLLASGLNLFHIFRSFNLLPPFSIDKNLTVRTETVVLQLQTSENPAAMVISLSVPSWEELPLNSESHWTLLMELATTGKDFPPFYMLVYSWLQYTNWKMRFEKIASLMMHMLTFRVTMEGPKDHKVKAAGSKTRSFKQEIESVCGKLLPPKGQRGTYTCLLPAKCVRRWSRLILPRQVGCVFL